MKPKNIFLIRHGQSTGNVDKKLHWTTPDWKITLTDLGKEQAVKAGKEIREVIPLNEKIAVYTSPYKRTIQTTDNLLSNFSKDVIDSVKQDPRLREQEYGNGMNASEHEKIESERVAYGTFFYRIKDGESGGDVFDRCSTFMETLHRDFRDDNFPENVIIVTHGFTLRVFLMRWFHLTVEEFETIRNPKNCQIFKMSLGDSGRYNLETNLEKREKKSLTMETALS